MKKRFLVLAGLSVIAATVASQPAAQAQSKSHGKTSLVKQLDGDNDGTLDLAEVKKAASAKFRSLDPDNDGAIDKSEAKKVGISGKSFTAVDPDKDGTIDEREYLAIVEQRFKAADPDHDGTVDEKELGSRAGKALAKMIR